MNQTHSETSCRTATSQTDLENNPRLLQQVRPHVGTDDVVTSAEADLNVLSKATAVVVSSGFCVSNSLVDRGQCHQHNAEYNQRLHKHHCECVRRKTSI